MVAQPTPSRERVRHASMQYNMRRTEGRKTGRQETKEDAKETGSRQQDNRQRQEGDGEREDKERETETDKEKTGEHDVQQIAARRQSVIGLQGSAKYLTYDCCPLWRYVAEKKEKKNASEHRNACKLNTI